MPIKYIGRTSDHYGKTLWEIVGNLKNFGVGRIVTRNIYEKYPEPSYFKIVKVETLPNEEVRKVRVQAEKVFRGRKYPKLVEICSSSYKADFKLIPKDEENAYCNRNFESSSVKILPRSMPFPPLMEKLILRDMVTRGEDTTQKIELPLHYCNKRDNVARIANEGETPTVTITLGLGTPVSPELYKDVDI